MCPTAAATAAAAIKEVETTAAAMQEQPPELASARSKSMERAGAEAETPAEGQGVKLSELSGKPEIIGALNAQTRRRAALELGERGMAADHPDYWCFELVRRGAPGEFASLIDFNQTRGVGCLQGGFGRCD